MNEAQTLLAIENLMKKVVKKTYHWQDLDSELDFYSQNIKLFFDSSKKYSPLIQAYFDLQSKRVTGVDDELFYRRPAFQRFQTELSKRHEEFIDKFCENNKDNKKSLFKYFDGLVDDHCKLLLVRVDLSYLPGRDPSIERFAQDIKRMIKRVQDKDTIFKDQVGYAYRLEQGGESSGYHCHLLVIYNGSLRCGDSYRAMRIGEIWKEKITGGDGKFFNCNQLERKQYHQQKDQWGLGLLEWNDLANKRSKAQKMLVYLADPEKDDQYIRGLLSDMRQFRKGQLKKDQRKRKNRRSQKNIDIHHLHEQ